MRHFLDLAENFRSTKFADDRFPLMHDRFERDLDYLRATMPKIVCLCGSTRFYEQFQEANYRETLAGNIVLTVGFYVHSSTHCQSLGCTPEQKIKLDELHKRKIDLCDEVLVINVGGYVGESTRSEIDYAIARAKPVRYLEEVASGKV